MARAASATPAAEGAAAASRPTAPTSGFLRRSLDLFFLTRPVLLAPVWAAFLLGSRAARVLRGGPELRLAPSAHELSILAAVTLLTAALYIVNQVVDVPVDRANRKLFLLPDGFLSPRAAGWEAALLASGAALLAARSAALPEAALLAVAAAAGIAYSVPPARMKARAGWDVAANGFCYGGFTFLLGWRASGAPLGAAAALHAIPYVFASGALFLLSTLEDLPGDRALGLGTSAVAWGEARVRALTLALASAAFLAAAALFPLARPPEWPALVWGAAAVPGYLGVVRSKDLARGFRVNQLAGRLLVLLAVPGALLAGLALAALVAASRLYHRRRFGLDYPRLTLASRAASGPAPR